MDFINNQDSSLYEREYMTKNEIKELKDRLISAKNVAVVTHMTPDGDAIGSSCAVAQCLKNMGINVCVYLLEPILDEYKYFDLEDLIAVKPPENFDLIIATDCPTLERLGQYAVQFKSAKNSIVFDHHISFTNFASLNFINAKASSACEYIYDIFKACEFQCDKKVLEFLYLGILRDTGGFMFDCTTSNTFKAISEMLNNGIDFDKINRHFMMTVSYKSSMLLKEALCNLNLYELGKIGLSIISLNDLKKYDARVDDTAGIINQILAIESVEVAILATEVTNNTYKVSFRSKGEIDVNEVAQTLGGGGHQRASGCRAFGSKERVQRLLSNAVKERFNK